MPPNVAGRHFRVSGDLMIDVNSVLGLLIIFQVLIVAVLDIFILVVGSRIARQLDELWRRAPRRDLGLFQVEEAIKELRKESEEQTRLIEYLGRRGQQ